MEKRHKEKRQNIEAIEELKKTVREKGDVNDKEFDKIMRNTGSKAGLDQVKGERRSKSEGKGKEKVLDQVKRDYPKVRKGEHGRVGTGRFNR